MKLVNEFFVWRRDAGTELIALPETLALCLDEIFDRAMLEGRIFYGQARRRMDVVFDAKLPALTVDIAQRLLDLIAGRVTSSAVYEERKCDACTLQQFCVPQAMRFQRGAEAWFRLQISNLQSYIPDYLAS